MGRHDEGVGLHDEGASTMVDVVRDPYHNGRAWSVVHGMVLMGEEPLLNVWGIREELALQTPGEVLIHHSR